MSVVISQRVEVVGLNALRSYGRSIPKRVVTVLWRYGDRIAANAKRSLVSGPKTGIVYRRRGVLHQASAPGQTPASDTGQLLSHIRVGRGPSYVDVGATVDHGLYLEEKAPNKGGRPWLQPAIDADGNRIEDEIVQELNK